MRVLSRWHRLPWGRSMQGHTRHEARPGPTALPRPSRGRSLTAGRVRAPRACGLPVGRRSRPRGRLRWVGLPWSGPAGFTAPASRRQRGRNVALPLCRGRPLSRAAGPVSLRCAGDACSAARGLAGPSLPVSASSGRRRSVGCRRLGR